MSFCVVNVAFHGSVMEIPYVSALIQLEGADMFLMHLLQEIKADEVRVGQWSRRCGSTTPTSRRPSRA